MSLTVQQVLDRLADKSMTLQAAVDDFRSREWSKPKRASLAQAYGVEDDDAPDPNTWDAVNADSRLTPAQYQALADAAHGRLF